MCKYSRVIEAGWPLQLLALIVLHAISPSGSTSGLTSPGPLPGRLSRASAVIAWAQPIISDMWDLARSLTPQRSSWPPSAWQFAGAASDN